MHFSTADLVKMQKLIIHKLTRVHPGYIEKQGKEWQNFFWISCSFIFQTKKSRAEKSGKIQIHNIILNSPTLDFLVQKIKEHEIQNSFRHSLPYFSIYADYNIKVSKKYTNLIGSVALLSHFAKCKNWKCEIFFYCISR